jgi:nucleotide-binding universal stress UspA family protein
MKQIWLVPLDGSDIALRSIAWIIDNAPALKDVPQIHLINVQPSLPRDISRFVNADTLRDFHRDTGMAALTTAYEMLTAAGLNPERHVLIGEAAPTLCEFATRQGCTQILIGTRGHSGIAGTLLGSVAMRVAHLSSVPVLLVR